MAASVGAVLLNLLCNLAGITDFSLPVIQDFKNAFKIENQIKKPFALHVFIFLAWLDSLKQANKYWEYVTTLYKCKVDDSCRKLPQLATALPSLCSKQLHCPNASQGCSPVTAGEGYILQGLWEGPLIYRQVIWDIVNPL